MTASQIYSSELPRGTRSGTASPAGARFIVTRLLTVALIATIVLLWMADNAQAATHQSCPTQHQIAIGENLTIIADAYGVSVEALVAENAIIDANLIVEGQSLCIPAPSIAGQNSSANDGVAKWGAYSAQEIFWGIPSKSYDPQLMPAEVTANNFKHVLIFPIYTSNIDTADSDAQAVASSE